MMQPAQLLKDFGVVGIALKHATIGALCGFKFLLLLIYVTDLEPDVLFGKRARRVGNDVLEALCHISTEYADFVAFTYVQTLVELLLLLIYYTEAEIDLVRLLEVRLHTHNLRESLLGML
jgi:hypothetical protein